jgi:hypothetical protein
MTSKLRNSFLAVLAGGATSFLGIAIAPAASASPDTICPYEQAGGAPTNCYKTTFGGHEPYDQTPSGGNHSGTKNPCYQPNTRQQFPGMCR